MSLECLGCGASLDHKANRCPECQMAVPLQENSALRPLRKRLSIPFATIVAIGFAWAVMIGGGKPGSAHPANVAGRVDASVNGKPVQIGGPAIAMLEQKLGSSNASRRPIRNNEAALGRAQPLSR